MCYKSFFFLILNCYFLSYHGIGCLESECFAGIILVEDGFPFSHAVLGFEKENIYVKECI